MLGIWPWPPLGPKTPPSPAAIPSARIPLGPVAGRSASTCRCPSRMCCAPCGPQKRSRACAALDGRPQLLWRGFPAAQDGEGYCESMLLSCCNRGLAITLFFSAVALPIDLQAGGRISPLSLSRALCTCLERSRRNWRAKRNVSRLFRRVPGGRLRLPQSNSSFSILWPLASKRRRRRSQSRSARRWRSRSTLGTSISSRLRSRLMTALIAPFRQ